VLERSVSKHHADESLRGRILVVPSRITARLPHLSKHDVAEIDAEVRAVLSEISFRLAATVL
jgi:hypothetical protein